MTDPERKDSPPEKTERKPKPRAEVEKPRPVQTEPGRPFRLVKYFSITGFSVILIFTLGLTIFISEQTKRLVLKKSEDYSQLLATNLNHQVFLQFVIPAAMRYGRIRLREEEQYKLLDIVVRNTIHSFHVERVNIYDLEKKCVYSTRKNLVGSAPADKERYDKALKGETSSVLTSSKFRLAMFDRDWTLSTLYPFRGEKWTKGAVGDVLGVFEIQQDLTDDYADIARFQYLSLAISIIFSGLMFFILRQILVRGEGIIQERNEERRRLEEKLHHSQRLANLGQMVAAVAHEIRNPLGIISSTAELLQGKIKAHEPNNHLADVIVEESNRLNRIVTEFLDFARPQTPKPKNCSVEDLLDQNLYFLAPAIEKEGIQVIRDYRAPGMIQADPDLLYRAFLNVFINAIQAMPGGGTITVKTSRPYGPDGSSLGQLEVVIADSGQGIDPELTQTVFDPFYTTKNRGSGLGLAIVKNIVDGHKGSVFIEPGHPVGTRLIIRLPFSQN